MEHPCNRCGSMVPDSSPFCPECGAPQVRFDRSEPAAASVLVSQPDATPPTPVPVQDVAWRETNHRVAGRERAVILRSAINAGVIAAILSLVPYFFIVAMPLGGFLAVLFYRRRSWRAEPSLASGFRLGALAGVFASVILGIVIATGATVSNHGTEFRQQFLWRDFRPWKAAPLTPEQRQAIQQMIEYLKIPQGMTAAIVAGAILAAIIFVALSGLGGMISASLLRHKGPRD